MPEPGFKLTLVQMLVLPGQEDANLARAERLLREAAASGARVALLPEVFHLGWTDPSARELAGEIPNGRVCQKLGALARELNLYICAGLAERAGSRIYNSAVLISPAGELLLRHRKIHELDMARELYSVGDRLGVVETELGRIGLMICADAFPPGQPISRSLGLMGAQLILSPCSWAVPADHDNDREPYGQLWLDNYIPVAQEFKLWIASASNVGPITAGPWQGRKCIGSSMVLDPKGAPMLRAGYGEVAEDVCSVEIRY